MENPQADQGNEEQQGFVPFSAFGCWAKIEDGVLVSAAMLHDGGIDRDDEGEINYNDVLDPGSQDFLDAVNVRFGTSFSMKDFGFEPEGSRPCA